MTFLAQSDAVTIITEHGPVLTVLMFIMGAIFWWFRYVIAPKAKLDMENQIKLSNRQITFIDNIESLIQSQDRSLKFLAVSSKATSEKHTQVKKDIDNMVEALVIITEYIEGGDFSDSTNQSYARRIRKQIIE